MADGGSRPALSRRRFINLVGKAGGVAAAYNTMAAMGLLAVPPAHARPPSLPGGSGAGPAWSFWARHRRDDGRLRAREGRLRMRNPGGASARRRAQLDDPRRRARRRDRHRPDRGMGACRQSLFQCRSGTTAAPPQDRARLLQGIRHPAAGDRQRQPQRFAARRDVVRRQAGADAPGAQRHPRPPGRASGQGDRQGRARAIGRRRRQGEAAGVRAPVRRAAEGFRLSRLAQAGHAVPPGAGADYGKLNEPLALQTLARNHSGRKRRASATSTSSPGPCCSRSAAWIGSPPPSPTGCGR